MSITRVRRAARVAAAGFAGIAAFQVLLAAGAPLGRAAYGGFTAELPAGLRVASAGAALVWLAAAAIVLRRGGHPVPRVSDRVARTGSWAVVGVLGLGLLANLASSSPWERFGWAPVIVVVGAATLLVARSGNRLEPAAA